MKPGPDSAGDSQNATGDPGPSQSPVTSQNEDEVGALQARIIELEGILRQHNIDVPVLERQGKSMPMLPVSDYTGRYAFTFTQLVGRD